MYYTLIFVFVHLYIILFIAFVRDAVFLVDFLNCVLMCVLPRE